MDSKQILINNILIKLSNIINIDVTDKIRDIITIELGKYDINKSCTDLVCSENDNFALLKKFIATKRLENRSDLTIKRYYEQIIKLYNFIQKPFEEITDYDIKYYLSVRKEQSNLCSTTVSGMLRCLSSFFGWLYSEEIIRHNPCSNFRIKEDIKVRKPFGENEIKDIKKSCNNLRDKALVDFLNSTGCRVSEVSRLDIKDIDFNNRQCVVLGKGNKERIVYINSECIYSLRKYINSRKDYSPALFTGKKTDRLSKNGIEQALKRLESKTNIKGIFPHRFRHTFATNLLEKGMGIYDISKILGHSDIKTTSVYTHLSQETIRKKYELIMN